MTKPLEAAPLVLGVISIFSSVLTGYKTLTHPIAADVPPEPLQEPFRRLKIQHARLRVWGEHWGLTATTREAYEFNPTEYTLAYEALRTHLISGGKVANDVLDSLNAMAEALLNGQRYGVMLIEEARDRPELRERDVVDLVNGVSALAMGTRRLDVRGKALRYLARCRWRIADAAKFDSGLLARLRGFTDDLYSMSPPDARAMMDRALVAELLAGEHDVRVLLHYSSAAEHEAHGDRIGPAQGAYEAGYRNLAQAAKLRARANLDPFLEDRLLTPPEELSASNYQVVSSSVWSSASACLAVQQRPPRVVMVEWKPYYTLTPPVREVTAIGWIHALAEQLCAGSKPADFIAPPCLGYFRALHEKRYGLVFEPPPHIARHPADLHRRDLHLRKPATLHEMLARSNDDPPDLGVRFRLAQQLAAALLTVHAAGALHRNLTAKAVLFFPDESADGGPSKSRRKALHLPWLVDWGYVRECGGGAREPRDYYHHPRRVAAVAGQRWAHSWDVYALGLILLEIGLWQPLDSFVEELQEEGGSGGAEEVREHVLRRCVPDLRSQCGGIYEDVVRRCLNAGEGARGEREREREVEKMVCWDVCARLMKCNA